MQVDTSWKKVPDLYAVGAVALESYATFGKADHGTATGLHVMVTEMVFESGVVFVLAVPPYV